MPVSSLFSSAWPKKPLGDLLTRVVKPLKVESNAEYREIGIRSHCRGIFHKLPVTGKQLGSKRVFWVEPGCLVLNIVFAWEQAVAVTGENEGGMIASHRFPMYKSIDGKLLPEYAYLFFSSPRGKYDLGLASPGGAGRNKTLGQEEFRRLKIPVPPSEYQKFAIKVIKTWDRAIAQTKKLIQAKRKLKKGLMQQLLTGKKRFPEFNNSWKKARLEDVCKIVYGKSQKDVMSEEGSYPIWGTGGIVGYTQEYLYDKPSVILGRKGTIDRPSMCTKPFWAIDTTFYTEIRNDIDPYWLYQRFLFIPWRKFNEASGVPSLSRETVYKIRIDVPDAAEQRKIAGLLHKVDRQIEVLVHVLGSFDEQKRGLMQKLLTGQIRVKTAEGMTV